MKTDQVSFNAIVPAPFGAIGIRTQEDRVRELVYLPPFFEEQAADNDVAAQAAQQVAAYLADPDFRFDLPLFEAGTEYQRRVWAEISSIPRGTVKTYGIVAKTIGSAPRAVGQACGANWFHLSVKRWLLRHEGATASPWQQQSIWD